jgi:hypothetical protein
LDRNDFQETAMQAPLLKMLQEVEEVLAQYTHLEKDGLEVEGVITVCQEILNTEEAEVGFKVHYQYTTHAGQILTGENQTTMHFPQSEPWKVFAKSRQVGAKVRVMYDPEGIYPPFVRFSDDEYSLEAAIATQQKVKEQIAQSSRRIQEQFPE